MTADLADTVDILGIPIVRWTERETIDALLAMAKDAEAGRARPPRFVTYANPHCLNLSRKDPAYREALRSADVVYADGAGTVWASRALGHPCPERVTASDFLKDFVKRAEGEGVSFFLLGGHPGTAERMAEGLKALAPGLRIAGTQHGFISEADDEAVIARVNASKPSILLLGMSVPKQEIWLAKHRNRLKVPLLWCVGGAFDFYSGRTRRAPPWVVRIHMEWFYRFLQEPGRMWKRYFIGNFTFISRVYGQKLLGR